MTRAWLALALALACSPEAPPVAGDAVPVAPAATVVIEPPRLRVGDVAIVDVAVVTPPGHQVAAIRPPAAVENLWLLDAEALPVETSGARELRRSRMRVRARAVGATEWPALEIEVTAPDGRRTTLATEPRPLEIVSVLPPEPESAEPFSLRLPSEPAATTSNGVAALGGAAATLAVLGLVALALRLRRRARERAASARALAESQPWIAARAALAAARAADASEWRSAGATGARALRRYLALRFGVAAIESAASEELAALPRPYLRAQRWQDALACLRELDGDRFRAQPAHESAARVAAALAAAEEIVRSTSPEETPGDAPARAGDP